MLTVVRPAQSRPATRTAHVWRASTTIRIDSPAGRECSGGLAGVSLELGRKAAPQGPDVQWSTRATVSTSRGSGGQAAGVSESGEVQARPRAGREARARPKR